MSVHAELLELLRCPKCHGRVVERSTPRGPGLACEACRLLYPIVDEIPRFLAEEATPLE
ncbi:MAG TPA: Trm112 family protein [Polyangia bacterium]|nr:Trm112 family protein [Polyangia bacterium]